MVRLRSPPGGRRAGEHPDPNPGEPDPETHDVSNSPSNEPPVRSPQRSLAAWEVGRRLNHLRFRLQQAWLIPTAEQADAARTIWNDLALSVRGLGATVQEADGLRDHVVRAREGWEERFFSLSHHEELLAADAEIARRALQYEDEAESSIHAAVCESLLGSVWNLCAELQQTIENVLSQPLVEIIRLGGRVDEGIHPRIIFRYMLVPPPASPDESVRAIDEDGGQIPSEQASGAAIPNPWVALADESSGTHIHATEIPSSGGRHSAPRITRYSHQVTPMPPASLWLPEVEQRWVEAGFSVAQVRSAAGNSGVEEYRQVGDLILRLDRLARGNLTNWNRTRPADDSEQERLEEPEESEEANRRLEQLGVVIDYDRQIVHRDRAGYHVHDVRIQRRLHWRLFLHFLENVGHLVPMDWLRENWGQFGRAANAPSRDMGYRNSVRCQVRAGVNPFCRPGPW